MGAQHAQRGLGAERHVAGQQVEPCRTQAVEVAALVDRLAATGLGRHVGRCAHQRAAHGHGGGVDRLGQAEVGEFRHPLAGEHDVVGFDVAVDDALLLRCGQTLGHLQDHAGGDAPVHRPAAHELLEVASTLDQFEHQQEVLGALGVGVFAEFVHRDHVLVLDARDDLGLALEARDHVGIAEQVVGDALDRHRALERHLLRAIDLAHRATAKQLLDQQSADARAGLDHGGLRTCRRTVVCEPGRQGGGASGLCPRPPALWSRPSWHR